MRTTLFCRAAVSVGAVLAAAGSAGAAPQTFGRGMEARAGERISLSGRVVLADGKVPPDPAEIETICGGQRHMQGRTKSDGGFQIQLGNDPTESMSNARDSGPVGVDSDGFGRAAPGAMDSLGHVDLTACEVRAVLPGYKSTVIQLGRRSAFESPDLGNIILTPYGKNGDTSVSPTSQQAPKEAQKSFEKGVKEARGEKPNWGKAAKDLNKAVELYPQYAEAWYELGEARLHQEDVEKAQEAFQKAIAADENFEKPYPPLSLIELKKGNKEESARLADKAVSLNPGLTEAQFYAAMAHHMLGHLDQAGDAALAVKKQGGERMYPRVLVILGDYFAQKQDFESSAQNYQQYVELDPNSAMAEQVRKRLEEWKTEGLIK